MEKLTGNALRGTLWFLEWKLFAEVAAALLVFNLIAVKSNSHFKQKNNWSYVRRLFLKIKIVGPCKSENKNDGCNPDFPIWPSELNYSFGYHLVRWSITRQALNLFTARLTISFTV